MMRIRFVVRALAALCAAFAAAGAQQPSPGGAAQAAPPPVETWADEFDGDRLDESKWELYTFDGAGGKAEVKGKQLRLRGAGESRSGVRTRAMFSGGRFYVEAALTKVSERPPLPGQSSILPGLAIVTVLFDGNPTNRIEWILRSDGVFEAWVTVDGRMERVDNQKLATKEKAPRLGIARRGEKVFFMLNGQVGLERTVRALPANFKVMLYGFGTTESSWDSVVVQTLKQ